MVGEEDNSTLVSMPSNNATCGFVVFTVYFSRELSQSSNFLPSNALPLSALQGVHSGGRDVPGGRDQGDQSDQGPQAASHAPVARVENRQPSFPQICCPATPCSSGKDPLSSACLYRADFTPFRTSGGEGVF